MTARTTRSDVVLITDDEARELSEKIVQLLESVIGDKKGKIDSFSADISVKGRESINIGYKTESWVYKHPGVPDSDPNTPPISRRGKAPEAY